MAGLRVHRLSKKDIDVLAKFVQSAELMLERGKFAMREPYEEWRDLDDDEEDKILLLQIRKRLLDSEGLDEEYLRDDVFDRVMAYEFLHERYTHLLNLLLLTTDVLLDNCCDTSLSYLEFHPSLVQVHVAPEQ